MTRSAILEYTKSLIDGLVFPPSQGIPNLVAYVSPPVIGDAATAPLAYIWAPTKSETRQSAPRPYGFKVNHYSLYIALVWATSNNSQDFPAIETAWPTLLEKIENTLRLAPTTVPLTDSVTGDTSFLSIMGDDMITEDMPLVTIEDQRIYWWSARITVNAREVFQG